MDSKYETVKHEGTNLVLTQQPCADGTDEAPVYRAVAVDAKNEYMVEWPVTNPDADDESDACDWEAYTVRRLGARTEPASATELLAAIDAGFAAGAADRRGGVRVNPGAALAAMRKTHGGGRPSKPTPCPKCGALCPSVRAARAHCRRSAG